MVQSCRFLMQLNINRTEAQDGATPNGVIELLLAT